MRSAIIGVLLVCGEDMKGNLAASLATTRISFRADINAHSTTTGGWVNLVKVGTIRVGNHHPRDAHPTQLFNLTQRTTAGSHCHGLVTTALASSGVASHGTMHGKNLSSRAFFRDFHGEFVTPAAKEAHATVRFFKGSSELLVLPIGGVEPLEFIEGFTSKQFLEASSTSLTDGHGFG